MKYLVSYNHSGNTWFRYCVEYLTKKPTWGHRDFSLSERKNNTLQISTKANPILIKRHTINKDEIGQYDTFILILRKPHECIKFNQNVYKEFLKYYALIEHYEQFSGRKFIVYYNALFNVNILGNIDLMLNSRIYNDRLKALKFNWEHHQNVCRILYNNPTKQKNANLKSIPNVLLQNKYIREIK